MRRPISGRDAVGSQVIDVLKADKKEVLSPEIMGYVTFV
jgi:hypothetical protein